MKKIDTKPYRGDYCFKFIARHNFKTFKDEIILTEGELINFLPSKIYRIHQDF